ncbi:hypothetical protein VCHENC02_0987B, partial [Vibrio harveyi]
PKQCSRCL